MTRSSVTRPAGATRRALWIGVCAVAAMVGMTGPAAADFFSIGTNFSGSTFSTSGFIPPDTMGAVGPNHITLLLNGRYAVYNKSGVLQQTSSLNQFWTNKAGVTPAGPYAFDPRILYDAPSGRWFAASADNPGGANNFLLAVSATSDPTGAWAGFQIDASSADSHWADYPMMGINNEVVTLSANMFPIVSGNNTETFLVLPKSDLLAGAPTVANRTIFENVSQILSGSSAQPAVDLTNGNLALPILSSYNKPFGGLMSGSIGGTPAAPTLNVGSGLINVAPRASPPNINQPGPKADIDTGNSRFSGNVIVQQTPGRVNASLWGVHTVTVSGRAALEWYEIDVVTNALLQSGVISDPSLAFNYPSISVNSSGNVVIGFSGGDPNTFMSTFVVVGKTTLGTTTFSPVTLTKAGAADYQRLDTNNRNRWGDYSATVMDPTSNNIFWTFQEFANATDSWQIQVTQIVVPEPGGMILAGLALGGLIAVAAIRGRGVPRQAA